MAKRRAAAGFLVVGAVIAAGCYPPDRPCAIGRVCVVAGTGSAGYNGDGLDARETHLYLPTAIFRHPDGRLAFVDGNNYRIRALEPDGTIATLAGNGVHAFSREGVPALESPFENPFDATYGPDGALYVAALHEGRILRIGEAGVIEVFAGTGEISESGDGQPATVATFVEPIGLAFDGSAGLYVADRAAGHVRYIGPDGIVDRVVGTDGEGPAGEGPGTEIALSQPWGISYDPYRNRLLIADTNHHRVCAYDPATGNVEDVAGTGEAGYSGDGGPATEARLNFPRHAVAAEDGTVYVADTANGVVRAVDPSGIIVTVLGSGEAGPFPNGSVPPEEAPLPYPVRLFLSEEGDLYISDWTLNQIVVWAGAGN